MKKIAFVTASVAALAGVAPVGAKEALRAQICGASGCITVADRDMLRKLPCCGETTASAPKPAPFYWIDVIVDAGRDRNRFAFYWVPSARLIGANGPTPGSLAWYPVYGSGIDAMEELVDALEPFAAPKRWPTELKSPSRMATASPTSSSASRSDALLSPIVAVTASAVLAVAAVLVLIGRRARPPGAPAGR